MAIDRTTVAMLFGAIAAASTCGFLAGRAYPTTVQPSLADPSSEPPSRKSKPPIIRASVQQNCDEEAETIDALEMELAVAEKLANDLSFAAFGEVPEWPADLPLELTPEGFTEQIELAAEKCAPGTLLSVDCSEPPCLAHFRPDGPDWMRRFLRECEEWTGQYGEDVSMSSTQIECPDGTTEKVVLLGSGEAYSLAVDAGTAVEEDMEKRLDGRRTAVVSGWDCGQP